MFASWKKKRKSSLVDWRKEWALISHLDVTRYLGRYSYWCGTFSNITTEKARLTMLLPDNHTQTCGPSDQVHCTLHWPDRENVGK